MSVASDLVDAFEPWLTDDLETYLEAIGSMFSEVEDYAAETVEYDGWSLLLDPARCPVEALPYLAQYVGERLPVGISESAQREWIVDAPNQSRGTLDSIISAGKRTLTGSRAVSIRQRDAVDGVSDDPDRITIITYGNETPNASAVRTDLLSVLPAGIVLNYIVLNGQTWAAVNSTYANWTAVAAGFANWSDLASQLPTFETYFTPL